MNNTLPVNINELLNAKSVEWERIEFKEGWNPLKVIQSICAFANDFNNLGGGYIIIGVAEKSGKPIFPPKGITQSEAGSIQRELLNLCHKLQPNYFPQVYPIRFKGKLIIAIWITAGDYRPYKAPGRLGKKSTLSYFIRRYSNTVRVKSGSEEERRLTELAAKIPFDDRVNHHSDINDIDKNVIKGYLKDIKSSLYLKTDKIPLEELSRQLQIAKGSNEHIKPVNVGLLMFGKNPEKFFKGNGIDIIEFEDDAGSIYTEKKLNGVLQDQLKDVLSYFKNKILEEKVKKVKGKAFSIRIFNYPYEAFEEILANAVYHRSYEIDSPIEVRIYKNKIEIISYPGALPPITNSDFKKFRIVARDYRNRRIGDFLKELHLTEGRATGIPTIREALKTNGSPPAKFEMDAKRSYFLVTLGIHKEFKTTDKSPAVIKNIVLSKTSIRILKFCKKPKKRSNIFNQIGLTNHSKNFKAYIKPLLKMKLLIMTIPGKPNSSKQTYMTSRLGEEYVK